MKYRYTVVDGQNKIQKGVVDAPTLKEATKLLIERGWFVKQIAPKSRLKSGAVELRIGRISLLEKVLFAKHLGTMIKSGISLNEALDVISQQTNSKKFKRIILSVLERIQAGQNLSRAMESFPQVFDTFFVNIIAVGEQSGTLEQSLAYLASELEDRLDLQRKIRAASFYPSIVLSATLGLGLVLAYFVLPKITQLFTTLQIELPLSTRILLIAADIIDRFGVFIVLGLIGLVIAGRLAVRLPAVKPLWHGLLLKTPIFGHIIIHYNLTIITRTMGVLLKSGLTIDQAIKVAAATTRNVVYRQRLLKSLEQVEQGKRFADALESFKQSRRAPLFPLISTKMIGVGERTGQLDESLTYLANYFEKEIDATTESLTSILEPVLLIIVGLIVGFVAISVISPIYQITGKFRR